MWIRRTKIENEKLPPWKLLKNTKQHFLLPLELCSKKAILRWPHRDSTLLVKRDFFFAVSSSGIGGSEGAGLAFLFGVRSMKCRF